MNDIPCFLERPALSTEDYLHRAIEAADLMSTSVMT